MKYKKISEVDVKNWDICVYDVPIVEIQSNYVDDWLPKQISTIAEIVRGINDWREIPLINDPNLYVDSPDKFLKCLMAKFNAEKLSFKKIILKKNILYPPENIHRFEVFVIEED